MRITSPSGTRNEWIDRNPTAIHRGTGVILTAGGSGVQGTYTVPAGRRARIECVWSNFIITTALVAGQTLNVITEVSTAVPAAPVLIINSGPAAIGPESEYDVSGQVFLTAGETIQARANIGLGAGTADIQQGFHGVEYDA